LTKGDETDGGCDQRQPAEDERYCENSERESHFPFVFKPLAPEQRALPEFVSR